MSATASALNVMASRIPAEEALAVVADLLTDAAYDLTIPTGDGEAYLRISNARGALSGLTVSDRGAVVWEYRSIHGIHVDPAQLVMIALDVLDPDGRQPRLCQVSHSPGTPLHAEARQALASLGMAAIREQLDQARSGAAVFAQAAVINPRRPDRGIVHICDDGELRWHTRAPHHPDGGLPFTEITATITRALTRAGHVADNI